MVVKNYHKKTPLAQGKGPYGLPPPKIWIGANIAFIFINQTI